MQVMLLRDIVPNQTTLFEWTRTSKAPIHTTHYAVCHVQTRIIRTDSRRAIRRNTTEYVVGSYLSWLMPTRLTTGYLLGPRATSAKKPSARRHASDDIRVERRLIYDETRPSDMMGWRIDGESTKS